jgi:hypothetical protein
MHILLGILGVATIDVAIIYVNYKVSSRREMDVQPVRVEKNEFKKFELIYASNYK